jgi:hypothetical protein
MIQFSLLIKRIITKYMMVFCFLIRRMVKHNKNVNEDNNLITERV